LAGCKFRSLNAAFYDCYASGVASPAKHFDLGLNSACNLPDLHASSAMQAWRTVGILISAAINASNSLVSAQPAVFAGAKPL
jgi:hypothetical protein